MSDDTRTPGAAGWPADPDVAAAYELARRAAPWIDEPVREGDLMSAGDAGAILGVPEGEVLALAFSAVCQDGRGGCYVPAREVVELLAARLRGA